MKHRTFHKVLLVTKRRHGLTPEAFRDYYETVHAPYCAQFMKDSCRYVRRYVHDPLSLSGTDRELPFDCITEIWFEDREARDRVAVSASQHDMSRLQEGAEDERTRQKAHLFDPAAFHVITVEECDSLEDQFTQARRD